MTSKLIYNLGTRHVQASVEKKNAKEGGDETNISASDYFNPKELAYNSFSKSLEAGASSILDALSAAGNLNHIAIVNENHNEEESVENQTIMNKTANRAKTSL